MPRDRSDDGPQMRTPSWLGSTADIGLKLLILAAVVWVGMLVMARLRFIILPVVFALLFSSALAPVVGWLRERGVPPLLSTWTVMLTIVGSIVALVWFLIVQVSKEAEEIATALQQGWESFLSWFSDTSLGEAFGNPAQKFGEQFSEQSEQIAGWAFRGVATTLEIGGMILFTLFFMFFFLKDGDELTAWAIARFGRRNRDAAREAGRRAQAQVGRFIRGQFLVAACVASATAVLLWVLGIPLLIPLVVLTFFGDLIPMAGPIIAGILAALIALAAEGPATAGLVVLGLVVIQQLESNVLSPLIVGRIVHLHPTAIGAAVAAGALIAGLVGAFLAVPLLTTVIALAGALQDEGTA